MPDNNNSSLVSVSKNVPLTNRPREHLYKVKTISGLEKRLFKEIVNPGDGQCGFHGMNLDVVVALDKVIDEIDHNELVKDMVYRDMKESFCDRPPLNGYKRFYFDEQAYEIAYQAYLLASTVEAREKIAQTYCYNNMHAYLEAHKQGLLDGQGLWYLLNPMAPVRNQLISETARLITAVAECHDRKITIFSRHYSHNDWVLVDEAPIPPEKNIYYFTKTNQGLLYVMTDENDHQISGIVSCRELTFERFNEINSQTDLLHHREVIFKHLEERGHDMPGKMVYNYTATGYKNLSSTVKRDNCIFLLHRVDHYNSLIPMGLSYSRQKEKQAIIREKLFLEGRYEEAKNISSLSFKKNSVSSSAEQSILPHKRKITHALSDSPAKNKKATHSLPDLPSQSIKKQLLKKAPSPIIYDWSRQDEIREFSEYQFQPMHFDRYLEIGRYPARVHTLADKNSFKEELISYYKKRIQGLLPNAAKNTLSTPSVAFSGNKRKIPDDQQEIVYSPNKYQKVSDIPTRGTNPSSLLPLHYNTPSRKEKEQRLLVLTQDSKQKIIRQPKKNVAIDDKKNRVVNKPSTKPTPVQRSLDEISYMLGLVKLFLSWGYSQSNTLNISTIDFLLTTLCQLGANQSHKKRMSQEPVDEETLKKRQAEKREHKRLYFYSLVQHGELVLDYEREDAKTTLAKRLEALRSLLDFKGKEKYSKSGYLTILRLLLAIGRDDYNASFLEGDDSYDNYIEECLDKLAQHVNVWGERLLQDQNIDAKSERKKRARIRYIFEGANRNLRTTLLAFLGQSSVLEKKGRTKSQRDNEFLPDVGEKEISIAILFSEKMLEELQKYWERKALTDKPLPLSQQKTVKDSATIAKTAIKLELKQRKEVAVVASAMPTTQRTQTFTRQDKTIIPQNVSETMKEASDSISKKTPRPKDQARLPAAEIFNASSITSGKEEAISIKQITLLNEMNANVPTIDNSVEQAMTENDHNLVVEQSLLSQANLELEAEKKKIEQEKINKFNKFLEENPSIYQVKIYLTKRTKGGYSQITSAIGHGDTTLAEYYIEEAIKRLSVDAKLFYEFLIYKDKLEFTILADAAKTGNIKMVKRLVAVADKVLGIDTAMFRDFFRAREATGAMPLHLAIKGNHLEVVKFLIEEAKTAWQGDPRTRQRFRDFLRTQDNHHFTPLLVACFVANSDIFSYLLNEVISEFGIQTPQFRDILIALDIHKFSMLNVAATKGNLQIVKQLVEKAKMVFKNDLQGFLNFLMMPNDEGYSPFNSAATAGHVTIIQYLIDEAKEAFGSDITGFFNFVIAINNDEYTSVHAAIKRKDFAMTKCLIEAIKSINDRELLRDLFIKVNNLKFTLLNGAAKSGDIDIFNYLLNEAKIALENEVNGFSNFLTAPNSKNSSPLNTAVNADHIDIVKRLIGIASIVFKNDKIGFFDFFMSKNHKDFSSLHIAVKANNIAMVEVLVNIAKRVFKDDIDSFFVFITDPNSEGYSPLNSAATAGYIEMTNYLIDQAKVTFGDKKGKMYIFLNFANNYKYTPLITAARAGHIAIIERLIKEGREVLGANNELFYTDFLLKKNQTGFTALDNVATQSEEVFLSVFSVIEWRLGSTQTIFLQKNSDGRALIESCLVSMLKDKADKNLFILIEALQKNLTPGKAKFFLTTLQYRVYHRFNDKTDVVAAIIKKANTLDEIIKQKDKFVNQPQNPNPTPMFIRKQSQQETSVSSKLPQPERNYSNNRTSSTVFNEKYKKSDRNTTTNVSHTYSRKI